MKYKLYPDTNVFEYAQKTTFQTGFGFFRLGNSDILIAELYIGQAYFQSFLSQNELARAQTYVKNSAADDDVPFVIVLFALAKYF
jgi:hypothetical protein